MKREAIVLAAIILAAASVDAVCTSCGSGSSAMTMGWNISGTTDEADDSVYCVGRPVSMKFWGLFSGRILDDVKMYALYNGSRVASNMSGHDGVASFTPKETGSYRLLAERHGYSDLVTEITVSSCQRRQETTTSTTTTSSSTTTTTSTTSSTTTTTTTTTTRPASLERTDPDLASAALFVIAVAVLAAAALFQKKRF